MTGHRIRARMFDRFKQNKEILAIIALCLPLYFVRAWEGSVTGDALHYSAVAKNHSA